MCGAGRENKKQAAVHWRISAANERAAAANITTGRRMSGALSDKLFQLLISRYWAVGHLRRPDATPTTIIDPP